jgi:hypothetical protein
MQLSSSVDWKNNNKWHLAVQGNVNLQVSPSPGHDIGQSISNGSDTPGMGNQMAFLNRKWADLWSNLQQKLSVFCVSETM